MKVWVAVILGLVSSWEITANTFDGPAEIVYIGDSHSLSEFGATITEWLRSRPEVSYTFHASGGSAPFQWEKGTFTSSCGYFDSSSLPASPERKCDPKFRTPSLKVLLSAATERPLDPVIQSDPNCDSNTRRSSLKSLLEVLPKGLENGPKERIAIVALGTNYNLKDPNQYAQNIASTKRLIETVLKEGFRCIWIGPPQMARFAGKKNDEQYEIIQKAIKDVASSSGQACELIDSRTLSNYPKVSNPKKQPDGIHYDAPWYHSSEGRAAARAWGEGVVSILQNLK